MAALRDTPEKVELLILGGVVDLNVILRSPEQPEKAEPPIDVTELGMVTEVRPVQSRKAELPIEVTELGIIVF